MAIVQLIIVPIGTETPSVSRYVAACHKVLDNYKELKYELTPMSTCIEGDLDVILEAVRQMHEVPFENGAQRVSTSIKIDDRRDKEGTMEQKIKAVMEKL
ncbi:MTH1187 family thiamine-binding protein [Fusibacter sp. JL216-2]|uniref:MTH1187 family thiamine-binding protein n=1 Tax=Fusibacter sp. JL216-2 TaxID=3071453 RepID=UPI003D356C92